MHFKVCAVTECVRIVFIFPRLCCFPDFCVSVYRLFPFGITVGSLLVLFIIIEIALIANRRLMPGIMMLGSFILIVLFITGIIETGIQLFGSGSDVNGMCQRYVDNNEQIGPSVNTLAWLEQDSICMVSLLRPSCAVVRDFFLLDREADLRCVGAQWQATFAFWIVGTVFLVWMMIMASRVNQNQYEY